MTPLRVAYLINQYPAVSHTFIRREIEALERLGVAVVRVALRGWDTPVVDERDRHERDKTLYVLRGGLLSYLRPLIRSVVLRPRWFARAIHLAWEMSRDSPRPLYVHIGYLIEACVIREWLSHAGVTHLHAHFADNPTEVAMLTSALGGPKYSFTAHGSDITNRPAQIGLPATVSRAEFVAAVSSFGRSQIWRWIPYKLWSRVVIVPCGLERTYGDFNRTRPSASSQRLVCIGRLSPEKGQLLLVEAVAKLAQEGKRVELVLVGDGTMRTEIESTIARYGLADRIVISGWLDAAGIQTQLLDARAIVVPSLSEGLPIVIMEAMAMGRPVIAPYLAGIPELVVDGRNGWLFPAGDVGALARAMTACLASSDTELYAMSGRAKEAVLARHDIDDSAVLLRSLFISKSDGRKT